ncbi:peptidase M75 [Roseovarius spongiae]|uniref:Peptidase M75 n=1 Tax=Roseovarius spongiae TaxID=2320272 RepID=A0A3A8B8B1_9RHOB|nr:imelysin family protein [Roseovarius spongiae]RKF13798.1 peptidase M75 [Roseovarius spongiae]
MKHLLLAALIALAPLPAAAQEDRQEIVDDVVQNHVLPRFETLAAQAQNLAQTAQADCKADSPVLRAAYGDAFDAWVAASHLRLGPTEVDDRAFALAFWPDSRGVTPRVLAGLIEEEDPIAFSPEDYADVSIAARGFYALEFLLYDERISSLGASGYRCALVRTVSGDIANLSAAILRGWREGYAETMTHPAPDGAYRDTGEALKALFQTLTTGLEFTIDLRLGRPLGTFDHPRPKRAEAWRSGRSARHVMLSLATLGDLAGRLAADAPALHMELDAAVARAAGRLADLDDPIFAGVSDPESRIRIEALQQMVIDIREMVRKDLGPDLGVSAGFNALDGD